MSVGMRRESANSSKLFQERTSDIRLIQDFMGGGASGFVAGNCTPPPAGHMGGRLHKFDAQRGNQASKMVIHGLSTAGRPLDASGGYGADAAVDAGRQGSWGIQVRILNGLLLRTDMDRDPNRLLAACCSEHLSF
jgi:hypothetical protein